MAVVEVTIVPLGTGNTSVSDFVAGCLRVLKDEKNLKYSLTPMGTIIEGELEKILDAVRAMHEQPFRAGAGRVLTTIRIDDRRDREITMSGKVSAVEKKLGGL
ncbi:MAG: MTH1187 family thiamine-binding protein [Bacillota bacterium]